jgi:hypothetical protein
MHQLARWSGPFFMSATAAVLTIASACSSSSNPPLTGDDGTDDAGGSSSGANPGSSSSSSSSSSGTTTSSSSGGKDGGGSSSGATVLDCGGSCDLATHTCCKDAVGMNNVCVAHGAACPSSGIYGSFACEGVPDCPSGQVCCGFADEGAAKAGTQCQASCPTMSTSSTQGQAQVCKTDGECQNKMKCTSQTCVGNANLNLCGLTSQPPYSCKAN